MPRLPLDKYGWIACDDACHKKRGSLGGTDYAVNVGTPVYAMFSGMARYRVAGTGGWTVTINRDGSNQVGETMHLSRANGFVLGGPSRHVNEGDLIAWSGGALGAPGAGSSTGPHVHAHVIMNGIRYGMEEYLSNPQWAGGDLTPIDDDPMNRKRRNKTMLLFIDASRFDSGGNRTKDTPFAIAGGFPGGGAANWWEFPQGSGAAFKKANDPYYLAEGQGVPVFDLDSVTYSVKRAQYLGPVQIVGGGSSDSGPVLEAVAGVAAQVAEIPTTPASYTVQMTATPK